MFKYFKGRVSHGFVSLFSGRMVLRISSALLGIFLPIFLYEIFNFNFRYVVYYYLVAHFLYGTSVAWGAKYLNKVGLRRSLRISIFIGALYYFIFYLLDRTMNGYELFLGQDKQIFLLIIISIIVVTLNRVMYWIPLHTDLAKFTNKTNRAKQLSLIEATTVALGAICPIIAGWILMHYNYDVLFIIAVVIYLSSLIPFITLPRTRENFSWTYWQTWKEFLSKKRRKAILAFAGNGAENVVGVMIWPIFIWEILNGNFFKVGAISSLIVVVTVVLQLFIGKYSDLSNKKRMLNIGSVLYAFGWLIKIFVATAFQIFIVSTYHNLTNVFAKTPFDALTYEKAADQGHYVDEYTVIHEMAVQYGKVLMLGFILLLTIFFSIEWTFVLAAFASLAMNFLVDDEMIEKGRHSG